MMHMFNHDGAIAYESDFQVLFNYHINNNMSKHAMNQAVLYIYDKNKMIPNTDGLLYNEHIINFMGTGKIKYWMFI